MEEKKTVVQVYSSTGRQTMNMPVNPLIDSGDVERNSISNINSNSNSNSTSSRRKQRIGFVAAATSHKMNATTCISSSGAGSTGTDGDEDNNFYNTKRRTSKSTAAAAAASSSTTKAVYDSDNMVTAATASTAQTSSSSSECHGTTTQTSTTASSSSGGDDDVVCGDAVVTGNISGNSSSSSSSSSSNGGQDSRSNHDRQHERHVDKVLPTTTNNMEDHPPPRKKPRYQQQQQQLQQDSSHNHHHHHHHQHRSSRSRHTAASDSVANNNRQTLNDEGSTLQVPEDDGSGRIAAATDNIEGGAVPIPLQAGTVVASRALFTTHITSPTYSTSSSTACGGGEQATIQNQHHLLLPPHREPGYHTIRKTLYRFHSGNGNGNAPLSSSGSGTDGTEDGYAGSVSSNENGLGNHHHHQQLGSSSPFPSVTSSEECEREQEEGGRHKAKRRRSHNSNSKRKSSSIGTQQQEQEQSEDADFSSELADFSSSGSSETMDEEDVGEGGGGDDAQGFDLKTYSSSSSSSSSSPSPSLSSSSNYSDSDGLEMSFLSAKRYADAEHERIFKTFTRKKISRNTVMPGGSVVAKPLASSQIANSKRLIVKNLEGGRPPILALGCDIMAQILTFLNPPEILDVLTMPLSKYWRQSFTSQPELWRVLCLVEPFKASIDDPIISSRSNQDKNSNCNNKNDSNSSSDETYCSVKSSKDTGKRLLDKYRLLYTSFVRCMKYISQIRDDAINGRPPAYIDYGISGTVMSGAAPDMESFNNVNRRASRSPSSPLPPGTLGSNRNLQLFLAQARDVVLNSSTNNDTNNSTDGEAKDDDNAPRNERIFPRLKTAARVGTAHKKTDKNKTQEKKNGQKYGRSMITSRLFGAAPGGEPGNMNLPWSCAIYSIVNWMVAFSDVEGLQILCLKVLPVLLENEQHRLTAQHAGLADVVLRAMVMFSESAQLHIAAFHTIVLLARPHGGREGMMFRTSMTADGIFRGIYQQHGKSGIAVMLDSMRRFQDNAPLLAMSCWALVNIALVSDQKAVLVKLGGIQAITNAMYRHPFSVELQFRALFALINLVIPSVQKIDNNVSDNNGNANANDGESAAAVIPSEPEQLGELNETTEREIIDELVGDIASLVVRVMKNFCSSEAILNRACLVLHNLSLTDDYHVILLWTPQCYQMLEWCIANFRTDQVLQQSATGTLHRLQSTLASNEELRSRFSKSLRTQQQHMTLKQARD